MYETIFNFLIRWNKSL